jgi:hypothetical protein
VKGGFYVQDCFDERISGLNADGVLSLFQKQCPNPGLAQIDPLIKPVNARGGKRQSREAEGGEFAHPLEEIIQKVPETFSCDGEFPEDMGG